MASKLKKIRRRIKEKLGMRTERPCFSGKYYWRARQLLLDALDIFNDVELPYFIDAGTLLGLVRDGDLISWDNDLDIMVPGNYLEELRKEFVKFRRRGWRVSRLYTMPMSSPAWNIGDPRVIKVRSRNIYYFGSGSTLLDITFIYRHEDYYWWEMANRVCRLPAEFFDSSAEIEYSGRRVRVPYNYEKYLECTYGDWRTPRKDFPHDESGILVR